MSTVAKIIEVSASSPTSLEDAVQEGLTKTAKTISNIQGAWVSEIKVRRSAAGKSDWRSDAREARRS